MENNRTNNTTRSTGNRPQGTRSTSGRPHTTRNSGNRPQSARNSSNRQSSDRSGASRQSNTRSSASRRSEELYINSRGSNPNKERSAQRRRPVDDERLRVSTGRSMLQRKEMIYKRMSATFGVALFFVVLIAGAVVGLLLPLRPKVSENENRTLAKFPKAKLETIWNGEYFSDVSLWYSDTYPMRDSLISIDDKIKNLYGIKAKEQLIGGNIEADEIPDITEPQPTTEAAYETPDDAVEETTTEETTTERVPADPPDHKQVADAVAAQIKGSLFVDGDAAYGMYYFNQNAATAYINAINSSADSFVGRTQVYSILVPNNSGVMLSDEKLDQLGGSNQQQAIAYYYGQMNSRVRTVDTINTLREHNDEYLYFRTDHHWTADAAYYVYCNFCKEKGIEPHDKSYYEKKQFDGFLGTSYNSLKSAAMKENPDYVVAYVPKGTNDMHIEDIQEGTFEWKVVQDVSSWNKGALYNTFIGGDRSFSVIDNPEITDGTSCLVIKESYGNAFVPFLVDHYDKVYVIDYRYATKNAFDFCVENKVDDLIIINNITIIGGEDIVYTISNLIN